MLSKITDEQRNGKGVTGLPDTPGLTTMELQARFDSLGNLAIDAINQMVDELNGTEQGATGADNLTASVPAGIIAEQTIQSVLNALGNLVAVLEQSRHTHDNKSVLDAISAEDKVAYDKGAELLRTIASVSSSLKNSQSELPTSAGVYSLLSSYGYAELKDAIYPIGSVYITHNDVSPAQVLGGVWEQENLIDGVNTWRRVS